MRQKREIADYLNDISDSITKIEQFTEGITYGEFTRDKLIHGYFGIDYEVIWKTIKEDLLPLKEKLVKVSRD